jgi:hypothetical protein
MLNLTCHCGQVRIEILKRPDYINECNCSLCAKSGVQWSYFNPSEVRVEGVTSGYCREDKPDPGAEMHFCAKCGATTHFTLTASTIAKFGNTLMGVNMRLADDPDLAGLELRYPDGRAWSGTGEFGYVREAIILGSAVLSER